VVRRIAFAVPGDLDTATGGYAYDRRMIAELRKLGWDVDVVGLGDGFPWPSERVKAAAEARLLALPRRQTIVVDGLAFGALPEAAQKINTHHSLVALVHHPLALESGLADAQIEALQRSERAALASASRVVATSATTARCLAADYAVAAARIAVACPGTDCAPPARGNGDGKVHLLSVGAVVPRKGFDVLIAALATMPDLPWRLTIAGDCERDRATAAKLRAEIARRRLEDRVATPGVVSATRLAALYDEADAFVLASRFEGYGMAYAEAIAHGLPIIGTTAGAIPEIVAADAGILVAPGHATALASALRRLIENATERQAFAAGARRAAAQLPRWRESAKIFAGVLEAVA
jgi:glycosyltransferase involved in cell wall biosynthesis